MSPSVAWCLQHVPFEGPARLERVLGRRGYGARALDAAVRPNAHREIGA